MWGAGADTAVSAFTCTLGRESTRFSFFDKWRNKSFSSYNAFILRCLVERKQRSKFWLYVYFLWSFDVVCHESVSELVTQSCLTLRPHGMQPYRQLCPWNSPGKNTGLPVDCHSLLQGIFPTQESNPGLLHCGQILYCQTTREALVMNKEAIHSHSGNTRMYRIHNHSAYSFL